MIPSKEDILNKIAEEKDDFIFTSDEGHDIFDGTASSVYKAMDEYWNIAIDRCIAKVKQLDTFEPSEDYIFSKIVSELEQLKKHLP